MLCTFPVGEKCPCGAWVAPAFHIDSGKVDKIPDVYNLMLHANCAGRKLGNVFFEKADFNRVQPCLVKCTMSLECGY